MFSDESVAGLLGSNHILFSECALRAVRILNTVILQGRLVYSDMSEVWHSGEMFNDHFIEISLDGVPVK